MISFNERYTHLAQCRRTREVLLIRLEHIFERYPTSAKYEAVGFALDRANSRYDAALVNLAPDVTVGNGLA